MPIFSVSNDPRGWPAVDLVISGGILRCHLWPVVWWQLEEAVAEPRACQPQGLRRCYDEARVRAERPRLDRLSSRDRDALAVRGIPLAQASAFAGWLGDGWRLPTDQEWRVIYDAAEPEDSRVSTVDLVSAVQLSPPFVRTVCSRIARLWGNQETLRLAELMLMDGNFLEWVGTDGSWPAGRGRQVGAGARHLHWPRDARPVELLGDADFTDFRFRCVV